MSKKESNPAAETRVPWLDEPLNPIKQPKPERRDSAIYTGSSFRWYIIGVLAGLYIAVCIVAGYKLAEVVVKPSNIYHQTCEQPAIQKGIAEKKPQDSSYLR